MTSESEAELRKWFADYLKYDNCFNAGQAGTQLLSYNRYNAMSQALKETGKHPTTSRIFL